MDQPQAKFEGFAVVEMMGHQREVGFVTTEYYGSACLFRVDVPAMPAREYELKRPEYVVGADGQANTWAPAGSKVRRPATPGKSRLVGVPSIYAITPCTEETAMRAIEDLIKPPLILLELPMKGPSLLVSGQDHPDDDGEDEEGNQVA